MAARGCGEQQQPAEDTARRVDDVAEPSRDRLRDLTALVLVATVAFLIASLATHHPADPPVPRMVPAHVRATNACGLLGAAVAAFA